MYKRQTLDSDGFRDDPILIKVAITIDGDEAHVDFAGSSPQVTGPSNSPIANTATCVYVAFLTTVTTPVSYTPLDVYKRQEALQNTCQCSLCALI